jgi:hypothetical protein
MKFKLFNVKLFCVYLNLFFCIFTSNMGVSGKMRFALLIFMMNVFKGASLQ